MGRKLKEIMATLPKRRREAIEKRAARISAEMVEASLQELRQAADRTQAQIAASMGLAQNAISQLERRQDLRMSTLGRYVKALGGKVEVIVELPGGRRVLVRTQAAGATKAVKSAPQRARAAPRKRAARGGP